MKLDKESFEEAFNNKQNIVAPPLPKALIEREPRYTGDLKDYDKRISSKLMHLWTFWAHLVQLDELAKLLNNQPEDKESEEFIAKQTLYLVISELGGILGDTFIVEELQYLSKDENQVVAESE